MKLITEALSNVFPKVDTAALTTETKLSDIEDWDSMNAVNLVVELESLSGCHNLQLTFDRGTTIGHVAEGLKSRGVPV